MAAAKRGEQAAGKERRGELVRIAFRHIAEKGFEGLRVHEVALEAGINNATLHYYFPTKEALIQGVVETLIRDFSTALTPDQLPAQSGALAELRAEFEDARQRIHTSQPMFVVFMELLLRSLRDPATARIFSQLDDSWRAQLVDLIARGVREGVFNPEIDPHLAATLLMAQIKGLGFQLLGEKDNTLADVLVPRLLAQVEDWLVKKSEVL
jgi:AcrR family transcriptional regulator